MEHHTYPRDANHVEVDAEVDIGTLTPSSTDNDDDQPNLQCSASSNSHTSPRTPPVQLSVSPEILLQHQQQQCGSSSIPTTTTTTSAAACYAAGHVLSGIVDKRKCRPRGLLIVAPQDLSASHTADANYADLELEKEEDDPQSHRRPLDYSTISALPFPLEASMHWLLSPSTAEEGAETPKAKRVSFLDLDDSSFPTPPPTSPSNSSAAGVVAQGTVSTSSTLMSPTLLSSSSSSSHLDANHSPPSCGSLGSGNVIQTPEPASSSCTGFGLPWLKADVSRLKRDFDLGPERIGAVSLSPKTHASARDPVITGSSFQFDRANSVDDSHFLKLYDDRACWFSSSTMENVSRSNLRISWREGQVSQIFEMDELDCCRCVSDEEDDARGSNNNHHLESKQSLEHAVDMTNIRAWTDASGSSEFFVVEGKDDEKCKEGCPHKAEVCACAESISTDGGGLVHSKDSDWAVWYQNHLL